MYRMTFPWPWPKVMSAVLIKQKFACLHDKVRITNPITANLCSIIHLVMLITWLDFVESLLETVYGVIFFSQNFGFVFFKVKHPIRHITGIVGPVDVKQEGSDSVVYWINYVTFDLTHDLDLGFFMVKFWNSCISGIVGLIGVKQKGRELIRYWAGCITLPLDHIHDLDLEVSRSKLEIALSQEWEGWLTWNDRDMSRPLMTVHWWPWRWTLCDHGGVGGYVG